MNNVKKLEMDFVLNLNNHYYNELNQIFKNLYHLFLKILIVKIRFIVKN